jgi:hypothetical protein
VLRAIGLALACASPAVYSLAASAAELQGTQVPLDAPHVAPVKVEVAKPEIAKPEVAVDSKAIVVDTAEVDKPELVQHEPAAPIPPQEPPAPHSPPPPSFDESKFTELAAHQVHQSALNEEQLARNIEERVEQVLSRHNHRSSVDLSQLVPIVAITFSIGGPLFLLIFWISKRYQNRQLRQQSLNANIDKLLAAGRDIPIELLRGDDPKDPEQSGNRDKGIRNIAIGVGILFFLTLFSGLSEGAIGFIWIALGVSQVLIWHLNQPKPGQQVESQD